MLSLKGN